MRPFPTALANLTVAVKESGVRISSESLPLVCVHLTQLQQLFQNLIGNAIKYRRSDITPLINIQARRENDTWLFSITDNGHGQSARNIRSVSLVCLSDCTQGTNIQAPASAWPFVSESWNDIMAASGSNPNSEGVPPSTSRSPAEAESEKKYQILVVEDSRADLFLIREAIAKAEINASLHVVHDGQEAVHFLDKAGWRKRALSRSCPARFECPAQRRNRSVAPLAR